ncbi:MAG: hypothetical protein JWN41_263, partial [Thermoleophilia bacterium]|nr:hypothetical protein [Thermoleophilia bacterium]
MDLSRTAAIARELERAPLRDTGRVVGGADNVNGALHVLEADTPMGPIAVVSKPMHAQALQEFVVSRSAARFGLAHLSPAIAMHGDDALIEFVTGTLAGEYGTRGIRDIRALDAAIAVTHLDSSPTMAAAMVRGRRDRELLGALDFAKANDDRHPHAVMVEPKRVTAFDGGSVGNGEMPDPLTPRLGPWFQAGGPDSGVVHLHDEAMEVIASIRDEDLVSDLAIYRNA